MAERGGNWYYNIWLWSCVSYGIGSLIYTVYAALGVTPWWVPASYFLSVVAGQGTMYLIFSTGFHMRLKDPTLGPFIFIDGHGRQLLFFFLAPEMGWLSLLALSSVFSYQALASTQRQLLLRLVVIGAIVIGGLAWVGERFTIPLDTPLQKVLVVIAILLEVGRSCYMAGYIADMRARLLRKTRDLKAANEELAHAAQALNATRERLVEADKLAALGRLVAGVAHELNTPLGNCVLVSSMLRDRVDELAPAVARGELKRSALHEFFVACRDTAELLGRNLETASLRVRRFMEIEGGVDGSARESLDLAALVRRVAVRHAAATDEAGLRLELSIADDLPPMESRPATLERVLVALITNALVHAFAGRVGGLIRIELTAADAEQLVLVVADDGVGIAAAHLPHVFEPFFTTRLGQGGSGLGLSTVRGLVVGVLGGRIEITSEVGRGTAITIRLPRISPA